MVERQPAPYGKCQKMKDVDAKKNAYAELYAVNYTARVKVKLLTTLRLIGYWLMFTTMMCTNSCIQLNLMILNIIFLIFYYSCSFPS